MSILEMTESNHTDTQNKEQVTDTSTNPLGGNMETNSLATEFDQEFVNEMPDLGNNIEFDYD